MSQEIGRAIPYDFTVQATANKGFIMSIGCCTVCFESKSGLIDGITKYLDDPRKWQREYGRMGKAEPEPVPEGHGRTEGIVGYASNQARRLHEDPCANECVTTPDPPRGR